MSERIKDRTWMKNLVIEGRKDWGSEKNKYMNGEVEEY